MRVESRACEDRTDHFRSLGAKRWIPCLSEPRANLAVDLYCYRIDRELGSLAAALGGLDAIVFTAGIGENSAIGWGVLWNSGAATIDVERPPGATNWAIGSMGAAIGDGTFDSTGTPVTPRSLYLAQLCERLGPQALANIGYK